MFDRSTSRQQTEAVTAPTVDMAFGISSEPKKLVGTLGALLNTPDPREKYFDLVVLWNGDLATLRDKLSFAIDWGPCELGDTIPLDTDALAEASALPTDTDGTPIACRFLYHGHGDAKAHFERNIRDALNGWTTCVPVTE